MIARTNIGEPAGLSSPGLMETIDPDSISAELLERDDETEPVQVVPPVVAVMVTNDAGPWFEESLAALGAQDYPSLSVLVLDNGSAEDPTDRIAAALPGAFVRRCAGDGDGGFAAGRQRGARRRSRARSSCSSATTTWCSIPTRPGCMVEEAYRSNAGIVGPKVVDRDNPDILLEVGMSIDHYGVPFSGLEPGESSPDDKGNWTGIDVDVCRAIAAVIFNDPTKVKFVPLSAKDRFTALQSGEIDVLSRNTTWTLSRDTSLGANFTGVTYYDGQGFLVKKSLKVNSALELNSASVCVQTGTTTEQNLADYFKSNNMKYEVIAFGTADETVKAYESGRCDVFTSDVSQLYAERLKLANPADHAVLPEVISKEPLGPMVRHGDDQWFDLVKWVLFAMVDAEELGVTQKNVDDMAKSDKPELKRVFGTDGNLGEQLGVTKDWVSRIVKAVGNYGEVFDRNVGAGSKLGIARGLNQLWNKGGIQYAPPIR